MAELAHPAPVAEPDGPAPVAEPDGPGPVAEPAARARVRTPLAWWRRQSLRARLTMLAALVVAGGLVAGALLLVVSLEQSLLAALDASARQRAQDVAALADSDRLSTPLPVAGAGSVLVQVVDGQGRVRAASAGSDQAVPLLSAGQLADAADRRPRFVEGGRLGADAPLRVVTWPARLRGDPVTVIAAVSVASMADSIRIVQTALLVGVPLLLALLAALTWVTVGSTLQPVGALRRGAEEITGTGASRRLPLPAAHDEVHRLGVTLNRMLDRLEEASSRQRAFVADAAHELRSPLAGMRAQLEVALEHPDTTSWRPTAESVLEDTLRLGRMVEDLLAAARLDSGAVPRREVVDLGAVVRDVAGRQSAPRVPLRVDAAPGVRVRGDAEELARAVQNLLDNALRHAATRVDVSLRAEGTLAVLAVADDGLGVPAADRERIFERFARLDDARDRDAGGTGLGLAIVRQVVRAHDGEVAVADDGPGARFVAWIPAERAGDSADLSARSMPAEDPAVRT
ncbi:MAG TPA: ATP-binding protein [Actinomycetes bacterium]|nr:ATP-binding protein [Actinomycetes bacterium]